jgi:putative component of membrane protein insertase Oxa1/YidC/SpoIIIJ protein YidD
VSGSDRTTLFKKFRLRFPFPHTRRRSITSSPCLRGASLLVVPLLCVSTTVCADPLKGPWGEEGPSKTARKQVHPASNPLSFMVQAYRTHISPIDGKHCPMYPSCSAYSVESFKKHGFLMGWMMTCDRLYRCGRDELRLSPEIRVNGEIRTYDPVENNDFWWRHDR